MRKALSKRTRFEVFKRDGFRCVYCGATPVQSPLHVDHVIAVANGGTDDPGNLATSCADCNGGKSAVRLETKRLPLPLATEEMTDHAEQIREYLKVQEEIARAKNEAVEVLAKHWEATIGPMTQKMYDRLGVLMKEWPHEQLLKAMAITAQRKSTVGEVFRPRLAVDQAKYFQAILRNWRAGIFLGGK